MGQKVYILTKTNETPEVFINHRKATKEMLEKFGSDVNGYTIKYGLRNLEINRKEDYSSICVPLVYSTIMPMSKGVDRLHEITYKIDECDVIGQGSTPIGQKICMLTITNKTPRAFANKDDAVKTMTEEFSKLFKDFCSKDNINDDIKVYYDREHASIEFIDAVDDSDNIYLNICSCSIIK